MFFSAGLSHYYCLKITQGRPWYFCLWTHLSSGRVLTWNGSSSAAAWCGVNPVVLFTPSGTSPRSLLHPTAMMAHTIPAEPCYAKANQPHRKETSWQSSRSIYSPKNILNQWSQHSYQKCLCFSCPLLCSFLSPATFLQIRSLSRSVWGGTHASGQC